MGADEFVDTESDGLPDHWEIKRFGGILFANAAGDTDHDGLNESGEYQYATDPHNPDTDGDQVPEGWEILYGFNPRLNDSAGDPDEDGFITTLEYVADTNPTNSQDYLRLVDVTKSQVSNAVLRWRSSTNRVYTIEMASGRLDAWNYVTNVPGPAFTNIGTSAEMEFFRIKAQLK